MKQIFQQHPFDCQDPETGRTVRQWTQGEHRDQHFYFTSLSVTSDDRWLTIISDRSGSPNIWAVHRQDHTFHQISQCTELRLAYCFPEGGKRGLNKSSPYLDADRSIVYWVEDDRVMRCHLDGGKPEHVSDLPNEWVGGFTHCSSDGSTLCVPVADPRAFYPGDVGQSGQLASVAHRLIATGRHTKLCYIDTATGHCTIKAKIPFWVTHVQFQPGRKDRLIFCSEAMSQLVGDPYVRIWRLDEHDTIRKLFDQPHDINVVHENFSQDGSLIIYHGNENADVSKKYIETRTWEGEFVWRVDFDEIRVLHCTLLNDDRSFVMDDRDGWINQVRLSEAGPPHVEKLCRHDSSLCCQDVHPHPIHTPSDQGILFTSDKSGAGNVYEILM